MKEEFLPFDSGIGLTSLFSAAFWFGLGFSSAGSSVLDEIQGSQGSSSLILWKGGRCSAAGLGGLPSTAGECLQ